MEDIEVLFFCTRVQMLFLFVTTIAIENERGNNNGKDHLYKEQLLDRQSIGLGPLSLSFCVIGLVSTHTRCCHREGFFFLFFLCCDMLSNIVDTHLEDVGEDVEGTK